MKRFRLILATVACSIVFGCGIVVTLSVQNSNSQAYANATVVNPPATVVSNYTQQPGTNQYAAAYWNSADNAPIAVPTTTPDAVSTTDSINYDWSNVSPAEKIHDNNFVAQFSKQQQFSAGSYTFNVEADDGVRLLLDNQIILDQWADHIATSYSTVKTIPAGQHIITIQYYEHTGQAVLKFTVVQVTPQVLNSPAQASTPATGVTNIVSSVAPASGYPLANVTLFNNVFNDPATKQAADWSTSRPADAEAIRKIASQPRAVWLGNWSGDIQTTVNAVVTRASAANSVAVLVAYNIPQRDCGQYSAGGLGSANDYNNWISSLANGIAGRKTVVILEPDAIGLMSCLNNSDKQARYAMLSKAVTTLSAKGAVVYIDASTWIAPADMAPMITQANIAQAAGFSLNVSGFNSTSDMVAYGNKLSSLLGGKHYVIDTSRNGSGGNGQWCNPSSRSLGSAPKTFSSGLIDAYMWIKTPGESDGDCNGGPSAGQWWGDYALGLAQRTK